MGDFNARSHTQGNTVTNANGRILERILLTTNLTMLTNTEPTFIGYGSSIIDFILITETLIPFFDYFTTPATTITLDHIPIKTKWPFNGVTNESATITIKVYTNANWNAIRHDISHLIDNLSDNNDIEIAVSTLTDTLQNSLRNHIPDKLIHKYRYRLLPYIVQLIKEKRRLRRQFQRTKDAATKTFWKQQTKQMNTDNNNGTKKLANSITETERNFGKRSKH